MKKLYRLAGLCCCIVSLLWTGLLHGAPLPDSTPSLNQGQKWRLGYYQGGEYYDYYQYLKVTTEGLMNQGWVEPASIPTDLTSTEVLWLWMADNLNSDYVEFSKDAFYSADWDRASREAVRLELINRLNQSNDLDLIMALGTWAGIDLVTHEHQVPTMVMSVNDPRSAGLIETREQIGLEHIYLVENPKQYERQVTLFHDLIRFKTLGVAYENSFEGRSYASIEMIERLAKERGFKVVSCHTLSDINDQDQADKSVIDCFNQLAGQVDAIYVTVQGGVNTRTIPELVSIANKYDIPTFSQSGHREVKMGYLMSLSGLDQLSNEGRKLSADMAAILNGSSPSQLSNPTETSGRIILNVKTAEQIGLYLDADLLAAADQIYWQIEHP